MISLFGAVFVLVIGLVLVLQPDYLVWVLAAAVPFTATAGLNIAGQSLTMYPLVAIALIAYYLHSRGVQTTLHEDLAVKPGAGIVLLLALWSAFATALAPTLFAGTPVLDPRQGIDYGIENPASLVPTLSNFAQFGYLAIGICTVIVIGSSHAVSPHLPAVAFGVGTVLSSVRYLVPETFAQRLFDNSSNVAYTTGEFNGVERLRGIFSEPSALGAFSVAGGVFFIAASARQPGRSRALYIVLGIWSFGNAIYSFSGGALVTGLAMLTLLSVKGLVTTVTGRQRIKPASLVLVLSMPLLGVLFGARITGFVQLMLTDKASSSSYENRSAADAFSYDLVGRTYGVGAGLGSNRPSSFVASMLSTIGYVGAALFVLTVVVILIRAFRNPPFHATAWALITIVVSKAVAGPDMSDPPMWFLLAVCAYGAWSANRSSENGRNERPVGLPTSSGVLA